MSIVYTVASSSSSIVVQDLHNHHTAIGWIACKRAKGFGQECFIMNVCCSHSPSASFSSILYFSSLTFQLTSIYSRIILSTTCSFILFTKCLLGDQNRYTHDHHLQPNKCTHTYSLVSSCASEEPIFPCKAAAQALFFLVVGLFSNWSALQVMGLTQVSLVICLHAQSLIQFGIACVNSTNLHSNLV